MRQKKDFTGTSNDFIGILVALLPKTGDNAKTEEEGTPVDILHAVFVENNPHFKDTKYQRADIVPSNEINFKFLSQDHIYRAVRRGFERHPIYMDAVIHENVLADYDLYPTANITGTREIERKNKQKNKEVRKRTRQSPRLAEKETDTDWRPMGA